MAPPLLIFPRDPHFLEFAGPVLDLNLCRWQGQPLSADEYVLSADEKTSIQPAADCSRAFHRDRVKLRGSNHEYAR